VISRPGSGGPRRQGALLILRTNRIEATTHEGIPITTPERTLFDLAPHLDDTDLARAVREAIRLKTTTASDLFVALARHRGRRGTRRLYETASRYAQLPINRTRSDAEALALHLLRANPPEVNKRIAGAEADLSWPATRLIVELDGPQFHRDAAEDLRKQQRWERAGWAVRRLPTDDVYLHPERLVAAALP
jgi:very-short-patch-repair endonuclease